jgi:hypoxanthine phosphoribosyltransferase
MLPANFKLQYKREDIDAAVQRMGKEITDWAEKVWDESHTDLVAIPVLRGGIFFFADVVRHIDSSVEIAPIRTWVYESTENNVQRSEPRVSLEGVHARGRSVLLVDDICDSGKTLKLLTKTFLDAGALEVKSAVLVKRITDEQTFDPNWIGFSYRGPEWMVGYGMEDCNRWRNLPSIYIIQQGGKA